jgi:hypothetical protein
MDLSQLKDDRLVPLSMRVPRHVFDILVRCAYDRRLTISTLCRVIIGEYLIASHGQESKILDPNFQNDIGKQSQTDNNDIVTSENLDPIDDFFNGLLVREQVENPVI